VDQPCVTATFDDVLIAVVGDDVGPRLVAGLATLVRVAAAVVAVTDGVADHLYPSNYKQAGDTTGAAPYARIFLDSGQDVILDPSYCATQTPAQAIDKTYQVHR